MTRLKIQTLRRAGVSVEKTAAEVGVSARTVQRVANEDPIEDPVAVDGAQRTGRPSKVAPFVGTIEKWLEDEPATPTNHILERLRDEGYDGSKSAVYEAVRGLRKATSKKRVARFEGLAGEFSQHDFGTVWVRYRDGSREKVKFFASCLKFSRMRRVMLVGDEKTESVCHGLADAFTYFEGVPLLSVFDNPKTIVVGRDEDLVKWNETFARFCTEAGIMPHATSPRRPQEKGAVEKGVDFVKSSFFKAHVFEDRVDLETRLEEWHRKVNDERPSRATGEIPRTRHLLEKPHLRRLGLTTNGFRLRYTRIVRTDAFVEFEGVRYYVAERHIGHEATLHVDRDEVSVWVGGKVVATHPRRPVSGKRSVLPQQREELIDKPEGRPYLKRELLLEICPAAEWCITQIRHRRPDQWEREVARLYALLGEFEEAALRRAFIEAARREFVGSEYIEAILRAQLAEQEAE